MIIPIDFVPGTHGNFLEIALNHSAGFTAVEFDPFNTSGASHNRSPSYYQHKVFDARHWSARFPDYLKKFNKIISIRFDQDDLLLVSSLSLLRAGDTGIDNNELEVDSVNKLNNDFYRSSVLESIYEHYPFLSTNATDIPRHVLREFYKFGFINLDANGYWVNQLEMQYSKDSSVFVWRLKNFYDWELFYNAILEIGKFLEINTDPNLIKTLYSEFINQTPFLKHKEQCDLIIDAVKNGQSIQIPNLTLFQESYINAELEKIFKKEMPFYQDCYFTNTEDVLYYINTQAPTL